MSGEYSKLRVHIITSSSRCCHQSPTDTVGSSTNNLPILLSASISRFSIGIYPAIRYRHLDPSIGSGAILADQLARSLAPFADQLARSLHPPRRFSAINLLYPSIRLRAFRRSTYSLSPLLTPPSPLYPSNRSSHPNPNPHPNPVHILNCRVAFPVSLTFIVEG